MRPVAGQKAKAAAVKDPVRPKVHPSPRPAVLPADDLEEDAVIRGVLYAGIDLSGRRSEIVEVEQSRFENMRFTGTSLRQTIFSDTVFDTVDLASFRGQDVSLVRCAVSTSRLTGSSWQAGQYREVLVEGGRADMALFRHSKLTKVVFRDVNLQQADFQNAELRHVRFEGCNLTGCQFANSTMNTVEFDNCTMLDIGGATSLKGATVRGPGAMELALSLARDAGIVIEQ